ncbi:hypothetical protein ACHAQA_002760 [Verticillium albo-atrum]
MTITYICNRCCGPIRILHFVNIIDTDAEPNGEGTGYITEEFERGQCTYDLVCAECKDIMIRLYCEIDKALPEDDKVIYGKDVRRLDQLRNGVRWANPRCMEEGMKEPALLLMDADEEYAMPYYPLLEEEFDGEEETAMLGNMEAGEDNQQETELPELASADEGERPE